MLATYFGIAVFLTVGISFFCSMMEALILSTTVAEIESLKKTRPKKGELLEHLTENLQDTISAILTFNTIANTAGSALIGWLAGKLWGSASFAIVTALLTLSILVFSEIIPKNLGVTHRSSIQPWCVRPLAMLVWLFKPVTYLTGFSVKLLMKEANALSEEDSDEDEEIILLAEKGAKDGTLTPSESDMVTNALKLDDVLVSEIMTPRTVVYALEKDIKISELLAEHSNIEFARIPVFDDDIDNIVGVVRRRDILRHKADDEGHIELNDIMNGVRFVPETVTVAAALQTALKSHQQILIVVDEYGSMAGVISIEDIMECILGREIFEADDKAIDMRELARHEGKKTADALAKEENAS